MECHPERRVVCAQGGWGCSCKRSGWTGGPHTETWGHPVSSWFVYFYPLGKTVQQELFSGSLICCVIFCLQSMCKLHLELVMWNCMLRVKEEGGPRGTDEMTGGSQVTLTSSGQNVAFR